MRPAGDSRVNPSLGEAQITKAQITKAQITKARITKAQITKARITKARITKAQITKDQITKDQITKTQITKARTTKARTTKAQITAKGGCVRGGRGGRQAHRLQVFQGLLELAHCKVGISSPVVALHMQCSTVQYNTVQYKQTTPVALHVTHYSKVQCRAVQYFNSMVQSQSTT